jgi:hypothetical protein
MARSAGLSPEQHRALARLKSIHGISRFHLAGGSAIAFHLGHRRSNDLDIFGPGDASFSPFQDLARADRRLAQVVSVGDATLRMEVEGVPVDVVRYPYALLEAATPGPDGFPVAGLTDLATNKLAAISRRGLKRDFWDLYAILQNGHTLSEVCRAYVKRFGVAEGDLYHVILALTWFEEAESESPLGMTPKLWSAIRTFFEVEAPTVLLEQPKARIRATRKKVVPSARTAVPAKGPSSKGTRRR